MSLPKKYRRFPDIGKLLLLLNFVLLIFLLSFILAPKIYAIDPPVPEPNVPCTDEEDPEFHSLRPYQASPCDPDIHEWDLYCGNDVIPVENITVYPRQGVCVGLHCEYLVQRSVEVRLSFEGSELPIIGNTELVPNAVDYDGKNPPQLDPAQRVNNYVSWYLNGVIHRAEEPYLSTGFNFLGLFGDDILDEESHSLVVDFSGPTKKLLPFRIQDIEKIEEIESAKNSGDDSRHNQIVGCMLGLDVFPVGDIEISFVPIPCYHVYSGSLFGWISVSERFRTEKRLEDWANDDQLPPDEEEFENIQDYWVAYKRWRGDSCLPIPFLFGKKIVVCGENPFKPNYWANLWSYVPLASTEDRKGDVAVGFPVVDSSGSNEGSYGLAIQPTRGEGNEVEITDVQFEISEDNRRETLYFPHLEETTELASILQETYVPQTIPSYTGARSEGAPNAPFADWPPYVTNRCDLADVRWNSGDDLFGEIGPTTFNSTGEPDASGPIVGKINYTAKFSCDHPDLETGCTVRSMTAVSVYTRTPLVLEIWGRLVAGNMSIFKRFFPMLGTAGMWAEIKDLPGVTNANYSSPNANEVLAGNPQNRRSGSNAEIYIPHLGGIQEYFLFGIQDALRPYNAGSRSYSPGVPGGVPPATGSCSVGVGLCSPGDLGWSCFNSDPTTIENASKICQVESGGNPDALNASCLKCSDGIDNDNDGETDLDDDDCDSATADYSIGLFQFNLHPRTGRCPGAWEELPDGLTQRQRLVYCKVQDQARLDECAQLTKDNMENLVCSLSSGGTQWSTHWVGSSNMCGIF